MRIYEAKTQFVFVKEVKDVTVTSSCVAFEFLKDNFHPEQEQFWVLALNNRNKLVAHELFKGAVSSAPISMPILFRTLSRLNAVGFLVAHNHPSEGVEPSTEDHQVTTLIKQAAELMQIRFLDHIIFSSEKYYSFADEGIL